MPVSMPMRAVASAGRVLSRPSGVAGALVEMRGGEDLTIEPGGEVGVAVEQRDGVGGDSVAGDGDEAHEDPVADEGGCGDCDFVLP